MYAFIHSKKLLLEPIPGSSWASEMVLNPAVLYEEGTGRLHMLFRATGPWPEKQLAGKPLPYPISLGYGWSDDEGENWQFDLERPALFPKLAYEADGMYITNVNGERVVNYANGGVEDPRLFYFEGDCYVITACRMFPPGPYWEHDEPMQCAPGWAREGGHPFGKAAAENYTVNVLWKVDLHKLAAGEYDAAFGYVTHLTDPQFGEDRDVLIFPERLEIDGKRKIVMLQRPYVPGNYPMFAEGTKPSIVICSADSFAEFANPDLPREILASPQFSWEADRIGASAPPIKIGDGEWLVSYHGKQDAIAGYSQSFMIVQEQKTGYPVVTHRCADRLIVPTEDWEKPNKFTTPCVFVTGLVKVGDALIASYGAADERVGVLKIEYDALMEHVRGR